MPDGTRQFAVYVAGTRTVEADTTEPFDMGSNLELYTGERSASYDATLAALAAAGAEAGDVVHAFGHSQGAMVTAHLALEGGYDTRTLVSIGSPVEADVGEGTLSISLRHRDDPVAALAGGGHAGTVGAPGSFVAERTADPQLGMHDYRLPAHGIDGYTETARLLDASTDPRMDAVRELFDELGSAASVEITEYAAQRAVPTASRRRRTRGPGLGRSVLLLRAQDDAEDPVDQRDDDRRDHSPPEVLHAQAPAPEAGDPGGEPQQEGVDDQADQPEREDVDREGQDLDDRADDRVHEGEDRGDHQQGDDELQGLAGRERDDGDLQRGDQGHDPDREGVDDDTDEEAHGSSVCHGYSAR